MPNLDVPLTKTEILAISFPLGPDLVPGAKSGGAIWILAQAAEEMVDWNSF